MRKSYASGIAFLAIIIAISALGCSSNIPFFGGDYSGALDSQVIMGFLDQGIVNTEGVGIDYKPELNDSYNVAIKSCSADTCVISMNLTVYYMSFYDKFFEMELFAEHTLGTWQITDYDILSETTIRRDV